MQFKIFTVPILDGAEQNSEMNKFLSTHRIIEVQQSLADNSYWTFCIKYLDNNSIIDKKNSRLKSDGQKKIDYKEVLSEEEFTRFSAIRAARKKLATDDAIPAFAVFTDAEIAEMSKLPELTLGKIKSIEGIGKGRMEHYGEKLLSLLNEPEQKENETV